MGAFSPRLSVMLLLLEHYCRDKVYCWVGNAELAAAYGCRKSALAELLRDLERAGAIHRVPTRQGRPGRQGIILLRRANPDLPVASCDQIPDLVERMQENKSRARGQIPLPLTDPGQPKEIANEEQPKGPDPAPRAPGKPGALIPETRERHAPGKPGAKNDECPNKDEGEEVPSSSRAPTPASGRSSRPSDDDGIVVRQTLPKTPEPGLPIPWGFPGESDSWHATTEQVRELEQRAATAFPADSRVLAKVRDKARVHGVQRVSWALGWASRASATSFGHVCRTLESWLESPGMAGPPEPKAARRPDPPPQNLQPHTPEAYIPGPVDLDGLRRTAAECQHRPTRLRAQAELARLEAMREARSVA